MKKIVSALVGATVALSCLTPYASAAERTDRLRNALADRSEIHILYNNRMVVYEDVKPINTDGRVMIPFRAALENMGAQVDYSDSERLVTAVKGDITIRFTLMDDTIYINNNGVESTMLMDVPMMIVEDRTLVPIRFMSEAFGLQVGWDGPTETVIVMDYVAYYDEAAAAAANIARLASLKSDKFNKSDIEFQSGFFPSSMEDFSYLTIAGNIERRKKGKSSLTKATLYLDNGEAEVEPAAVNALVRDEILYFKTNGLKNLTKITDNAAVNAAAQSTNSNKWYSVDLSRLFRSFGAGDGELQIINTMIGAAGSVEIGDVLQKTVIQDGEAELADALSLASQLDVYEIIDPYVNVKENDGDYSVEMVFSSQEFMKLLTSVYGDYMTEEELVDMMTAMTGDVEVTIKGDELSQESDVITDTTFNSVYGSYLMQLWIAEKQTEDNSEFTADEPVDAEDITDAAISLFTPKEGYTE